MVSHNYIEEQFDRLQTSANSNQLTLLNRYVDELEKWNRVYNLTAMGSREKLVDLLVVDSVLAAYHLDFIKKSLMLKKLTILDVGSGNGTPGVVWAVIRRNTILTFVEKSRKKAAFLNHILRQLGLKDRSEVHNQRIEDCVAFKELNLITCRAFMNIEPFLEITYQRNT